MYKTHITQYLDDNVAAYPERIAVIDGDEQLTFSELRTRALIIATAIKSICPRKQQVIAVYLPKSENSIISDVAIAYSGNIYMNLDIRHPEQRIKNILATTNPSLLITNKGVSNNINGIFTNIPVLYIEDIDFSLLSDGSPTNEYIFEQNNFLDVDLLCIINTSGSTGTPKAVALTHRGFIDLIANEVNAGLLGDELECVASLAPLVFDHHSFEISLMMMRAATLCIIPEQFAAFPVRMLELMERVGTTFLFWVPTIMVNIANMDLLSKFPLLTLRKVWFAGEVFPTVKFNYWRKHLPAAEFVNLYGPTEISVDCTFYRINRILDDNELIPIGHPIPNREVFLLGEHGKISNIGVDGEICVRGICLAHGYYNNPEKTSAAFVQNPLNPHYPERIYRTGDIGAYNNHGELLFRGRRDTLIKHSGYRIELGEIENVVNSTCLVRNCCALYNHTEKKIVLIYEQSGPIQENELRKKIGKVLPRYMIPSIFIHVEAMPRNTNGKIDRLLLSKELLI